MGLKRMRSMAGRVVRGAGAGDGHVGFIDAELYKRLKSVYLRLDVNHNGRLDEEDFTSLAVGHEPWLCKYLENLWGILRQFSKVTGVTVSESEFIQGSTKVAMTARAHVSSAPPPAFR